MLTGRNIDCCFCHFRDFSFSQRCCWCGAYRLGVGSLRDLNVQAVIYWYLYTGCYCRKIKLQHINFTENIWVCLSTTLNSVPWIVVTKDILSMRIILAPRKPHHRSILNLSKLTCHVMHHQFNIQQLYVLPTFYWCVLYLSEKKQGLCPVRNELIGFYNRDEKCLQRGTDWVSKLGSLRFFFIWLMLYEGYSLASWWKVSITWLHLEILDTGELLRYCGHFLTKSVCVYIKFKNLINSSTRSINFCVGNYK